MYKRCNRDVWVVCEFRRFEAAGNNWDSYILAMSNQYLGMGVISVVPLFRLRQSYPGVNLAVIH